MSENLQSGMHPDPDSLSAFVEGVLPEHERLACLTHLAECPDCREVVYLAQEPFAPVPLPVPATPEPERVSFWKRWFTPIPVLSAAVVAGIVVLSVWLYQYNKSAVRPPEMASVQRDMEVGPPAVQRELAPTAAPKAPVESLPQAKRKVIPAPEVRQVQASADVAVSAAPAAAVSAALQNPAPSAAPPMPSPLLPTLTQTGAEIRAQAASQMALKPAPQAQAGIAGTITDPSGAAVPAATVSVRPLTSQAGTDFRSDSKGQFQAAGLVPGRYELQVEARGFQLMKKQIDVQPGQVARADSTLQVGTVSESVMVTAATPALSTSVASLASVRPLPSSRPAATTVSSGKVMLSTDSSGTLFLSQDAGKKWKTIKPVWRGRIVGLIALSGSPKDPAFQLTTETGEVWLSRDGSRWYPASTQH